MNELRDQLRVMQFSMLGYNYYKNLSKKGRTRKSCCGKRDHPIIGLLYFEQSRLGSGP